MSAQNDGGPAFPVPVTEGPMSGNIIDGQHFGNAGMTLRDYFIAHAPEMPQPWFQPKMPTPRPLPCWVSNDGHVYVSWMEAEKVHGEDYIDANLEAERAWDNEHVALQWKGWPVAWADAMLAARQS